jgi:SAM-dependent methyltransferase
MSGTSSGGGRPACSLSSEEATAGLARAGLHCGRIAAGELLDEPGISPEIVAANLRDLEFVNTYLGGAAPVLAHVKPVLQRASTDRPLEILDIACGGGDLLRAIAHLAHTMGHAVRGVGVDANPLVIGWARAQAMGLSGLRWIRADALCLPFAASSFDVVTCSTFLHHLQPDDAVPFLARARSIARTCLIVSDLMRSHSVSVGFAALAWVLDLAPITRRDGAISLRRAYTPDELDRLARAAGLTGYRIERHRFCRMSLVCGPNGD